MEEIIHEASVAAISTGCRAIDRRASNAAACSSILPIDVKKVLIKKLKSVGMTLAKVKEQDGMMLAKGKEQDGMLLAKVKEQDGMMLAKVKEQDWMMLANVKVPSIPTSAACCDDVPLTDAESSYYTFYNRQLLNRTASSKPQTSLVSL